MAERLPLSGGPEDPGVGQSDSRIAIWRIAGTGAEWEVLEIPASLTCEPHTLMIGTLAECRAEYPGAVVE